MGKCSKGLVFKTSISETENLIVLSSNVDTLCKLYKYSSPKTNTKGETSHLQVTRDLVD